MFPTFDIVKELCKKQGISINTLEERVGFSRNSLYSWRNSSPKPEKLNVIADYFNLSTDYLLGRTKFPYVATSENAATSTNNKIEEQALVMFRKETANMTDMEKQRFNNALSGLMQTARSLIEDDSNWK
ncbi:XRE family transcriptional regulator [Streptococcus sp. KCJ4932]|uniref:helix-turn-helix domain-containing protein n=1 Tax=Streptococcus sp. KCJ4932 TaxID=2545465 RepID=UPI0010558A62|nr:helix-turn-helix transcriptional regulator [Streptococcus sp. KCJ4932]TDE68623.1 XRE family transcriptional regulator [Streptococcus sp. KCJ4932]